MLKYEGVSIIYNKTETHFDIDYNANLDFSKVNFYQ